MSFPYISIIIPTKNAGSRIDYVLKAIFSNKINFATEVIIIDSGSCDQTKDIISGYPVKFIAISPASFSHGGTRNLAAQIAKGKILIFLTQDAIPRDENWLISLIEGFKIPGVAGIFGRQLPNKYSSPIESFFLSYLYPGSQIIKDSVDPDNCLLRDIFFSNVNSAILRSEWEENKFDEKLIMSEDQDWAKRILLKRKKIIYEPSAAVLHSHRYTMLELIGRNFDSGMSLKNIVNAPFQRSARYEINFLKEGIRFLIRNRFYANLAIFPFYEFLRLLAFSLGFHSRYLPWFLKKRISQNKIYWLSHIKNTPL